MSATGFVAERFENGGWGSPDPTARAMEFYLWIFDQTDRNGYQPTFRDAMARFNLSSTNGCSCYINGLVRHGWASPPHGRRGMIRFLVNPDGTGFEGFSAWGRRLAESGHPGPSPGSVAGGRAE